MISTTTRRKFVGGLAALVGYNIGCGPNQDLKIVEASEAIKIEPRLDVVNDEYKLFFDAYKAADKARTSRDRRIAFDKYENLINYARNKYNETGSNAYKGLEVVGLMHQALLLNLSANNIINKGEKIEINSLWEIACDRDINDNYGFYNKFRAFANYEAVEKILTSEKAIPENAGFGLGNIGKVPSRELVHARMAETIDNILKIGLPIQYSNKLQILGKKRAELLDLKNAK